jgi:hypothetical protein
MKTILFMLICCLSVSWNARSQDSLKKTGELPYKPVTARINLVQGQYFSGYIMAIRDSSMFIYQKGSAKHGPFYKANIYDESTWQKYHSSYVESVKVGNHSLRSWLIPTTVIVGVLAGAFVGGSLSKSSNVGFGEAFASLGSIVLGGLIGGGVGVAAGLIIAGSTDKKYLINGEWKNLEQMKESLHY